MNLKNCRDCGKQYSVRAPSCIHCGAPNDDFQHEVVEEQQTQSSFGSWILSAVIFVVVLLAMVPDFRAKAMRMIDPDAKIITENDMRDCNAEGTLNMMRMAFDGSQYAMSLNLKAISIQAYSTRTKSGSVLTCDATLSLNNGQDEHFIFNFTKKNDDYLVLGEPKY